MIYLRELNAHKLKVENLSKIIKKREIIYDFSIKVDEPFAGENFKL